MLRGRSSQPRGQLAHWCRGIQFVLFRPEGRVRMSAENLSVGEFGVAFKGFLEHAVAQAPAPEPFFRARLTEHFGTPPAGLPILAEQFAGHEHPNLQVALDEYMAAEGGHTVELLGVASDHKRMMGLGLSDLMAATRPALVAGGGTLGRPGRLREPAVRPRREAGLRAVRALPGLRQGRAAGGAGAGRRPAQLRPVRRHPRGPRSRPAGGGAVLRRHPTADAPAQRLPRAHRLAVDGRAGPPAGHLPPVATRRP